MRRMLLALPFLISQVAQAQEIKTIVGGNRYESSWVLIDGPISAGATEKLQEHLTKHYLNDGSAIPTIALNSPGGSLIEGLKLGLLFRELSLTTTIARQVNHFQDTDDKSVELGWVAGDDAICASACAYAFLGGVDRYMAEDGQIGFHQFYNNSGRSNLAERIDENDVSSDAQFITGLLVEYLDELGDISFLILAEAAKATKDEMNWLSRDLAIELRVVSGDLFGKFFLEPFGEGVVAASRTSLSDTGYDTSRVYFEVAQATAFCRSGRQYLMLSSQANQDIQLLDHKVTWWFEHENEVTTFETTNNAKVRTNEGRTYIDLDVTNMTDWFGRANNFALSVAVPRSQGGNFTFKKSLTLEEQSMLDAAFRICI